MPTTRPRYAITETAAVARALEKAALRWPEDRDRPSRLILRLVEEGSRALAPELDARTRRRLDAIDRIAGSVDYPVGHLAELRGEWPE